MKQFIARELRRVERKNVTALVKTVIATSGTAAALSEAGRALVKTRVGAAGRKQDANMTPARAVRRLADKLTRLDNAARAAISGIGPRRAEIIVAGSHVFAEILDRFALPGFRYSTMGLRDGILAQMLAEQDARTSVHLQLEKERWEGVLETCRRYGVDPKQAEPVCEHATQMFRDLERVHELPGEYLDWLRAAAMMRDIGKFMNYQGYHRHAQYIIANSEALRVYAGAARGYLRGRALSGQEPAGARGAHDATGSSRRA